MLESADRDGLRGIVLSALLILSVVASVPLGGAASAAAAGTISATDYSLVETSGYTDEPLNASVTVNNTKETKDSKQVVVEWYDEDWRTWKTVGSRNVTVSANSERTVNVTYFIEKAPNDNDAKVRVNSLSSRSVGIQRADTYITDITPASSTVSAGNSVPTSVTIKNYGSETLEQRVTLEWGASSSKSKVIELAAREERVVDFSPTLDIAGYQTLKAAHSTSTPVHVTNSSMSVAVSDRTLQTQSLYTQNRVVANATVSNNGDEAVQYAVTVTANRPSASPQYTTKIVTLGGDSSNVTAKRYLHRPGEYRVSLNGKYLGNTTVTRPYNATNLTVDESEVIAGQPATVTVDVENRKTSQVTRGLSLEAQLGRHWERLAEKEFTLNGSEQKELTFDVAFNDAGTYPIRAANSEQTSVEVLSVLNVSNVSLPADPVYTEEPVSVNATVTNRLDSSTTKTVLLEEETNSRYRSLASKDVQLDAGESKRVSIPYTFSRDGSRTIRIGGDETRTIDIKYSPVRVTGVVVSDRVLDAGTETTITATLHNGGQNGTEFNATLNIDGDEYDTGSRQLHKTVYVAADSKETVSFTPSFSVGGSHSVAVGYEDAGIVSVNDSDVSVVSGSVGADTVYKRDTTPVSVTLNNTAGESRDFAVTARADMNTSEWGTETNTAVLSLGPNTETTADIPPSTEFGWELHDYSERSDRRFLRGCAWCESRRR